MTTFPIATPAAVRQALSRQLRGRRWALVGAAAVLATAAAAGLVMPNAMGGLVDLVVSGGGRAAVSTLLVLGLVMALGVVISAVLTAVGTIGAVRIVETVIARIRERLVAHLVELPQPVVEEAGSGDAVSRTTDDVAEVSRAVNQVLPAVSGALFTIVLTFVGLAVIDWRFCLALALVIPIQALAVRFYLSRAPAQYAAERAAMAERAEAVLGSLRGIDAVRAHQLEPQRRALIARHSWQVVHWAMHQRVTNNLFWGRLNLAEFCGMSLLLLTGFWLVGIGAATTGTTTAAVLLFHRLFGPIGQLLMVVDTWQSAAASLRRVVGVLSIPLDQGQQRVPPTIAAGALTVRGARFSYDPALPPTLAGIDLQVQPGSTLAVVGASGAGKSTLAAVVAGLRTLDAGTVVVDGVDLATLGATARARVVGLVTQESHIFDATVRDNLTLAADPGDDALWRALGRVGAEDWVATLPDGLGAVLGVHGVTPTGTQAQQLALARLDLLDPPVVILDEATAEAGSVHAAQLDAAAATVTAARTTITIAHRLDQARTADEIAFVDEGRIIERGSHADLIAAGGAYAELWAAWSRGRDERA